MDDPGAEFIVELADHELEALVETMYLVAYSDGSYSAPERARFAHCVSKLTDGRMAGAHFDHVVARIVCRLRDDGMEACVRALRDRLAPRLRSVALILASDMAAADGVLHPAERKLLLSLADAFQMHPEETREVLDGFASS
ncbi:MAG TPA: tellurite resistance TerB family protein [Polyangiaceae bacterium]|nr:tellurite resistance TerB family protein [Polyangiaceae bacterium]